MSWRTTRASAKSGEPARHTAVIDLGSNSWRLVVFSYGGAARAGDARAEGSLRAGEARAEGSLRAGDARAEGSLRAGDARAGGSLRA
ncbi:MAG TPA: hypothetical protein VFP55_13205, partial [Solirubrobacteraceae bacterium]|nr:hypothetical protein [Solirubrobacteraceae bacterium]